MHKLLFIFKLPTNGQTPNPKYEMRYFFFRFDSAKCHLVKNGNTFFFRLRISMNLYGLEEKGRMYIAPKHMAKWISNNIGELVIRIRRKKFANVMVTLNEMRRSSIEIRQRIPWKQCCPYDTPIDSLTHISHQSINYHTNGKLPHM